jgi:hypothetical protein
VSRDGGWDLGNRSRVHSLLLLTRSIYGLCTLDRISYARIRGLVLLISRLGLRRHLVRWLWVLLVVELLVGLAIGLGLVVLLLIVERRLRGKITHTTMRTSRLLLLYGLLLLLMLLLLLSLLLLEESLASTALRVLDGYDLPSKPILAVVHLAVNVLSVINCEKLNEGKILCPSCLLVRHQSNILHWSHRLEHIENLALGRIYDRLIVIILRYLPTNHQRCVIWSIATISTPWSIWVIEGSIMGLLVPLHWCCSVWRSEKHREYLTTAVSRVEALVAFLTLVCYDWVPWRNSHTGIYRKSSRS